MDTDTAMGYVGHYALVRTLGPHAAQEVIDALGAEVDRLRKLCRDVAGGERPFSRGEGGDALAWLSRATLEAVKKEAGRA